MRFEKGVEVFSSAGEKIGKISRVVIDTKTKDVTDVVVDRGKDEKVIPVSLVESEDEDRLTLHETHQSVRFSRLRDDTLCPTRGGRRAV